jgi:pimeloyl-ACP methyl ester carboxylesterase
LAIKRVRYVRRHLKSWKRLIPLLLLIGVVGYYLVLPFVRAFIALHPARTYPYMTPDGRGLAYENVTFASLDNIQLVGWYIPSKNRAAVILTHGFGANRGQLLGQAEALARAGFGVLLYDCRAHGDSKGDTATRGWLEVNDLLGALAYVETRSDVDPERIGAFGLSVGGQVTIRVAATTNRIKAVATEGTPTATFADEVPRSGLIEWLRFPSTWMGYQTLHLLSGVSPPPAVVEVIGKIAPRPLLLISTGQEFEQRRMRLYYGVASQPKTLWEIPETHHGGGFEARLKEYGEKLVKFFSEALLY